jgi:hypothetical protein
VALEATFRLLSFQLQNLADNLQVLCLTLGDKPLEGDVALVDHLENTVLDMTGLLQDAMLSTREAQKAVEPPLDLERARRALSTCQKLFRRIEQEFSANLVSYEKLKDLTALGSKRSREWFSWTRAVKQGIELCRIPLDQVGNALVECWQEFAERLGTRSIAVLIQESGEKLNVGEGEKSCL